MTGLRQRHRQFVEEYLICWNGTEAARRVGCPEASAAVTASRWLKNAKVQAYLQARIKETAMGADEVLTRLAAQARGDLGQFFKVSERWTANPAPTQEITADREVIDDEGKAHIEYLVRCVVLDVEKLLDPRYSSLVHKFIDSPTRGISLELYDAQEALHKIGKDLGRFVERGEEKVTIFDLDEWQRQRAERRKELDALEESGGCAETDGQG